jgi:hypothetical protein
MHSNDDEALAAAVLTDLGLRASKVPRAQTETPDFTAVDPAGGRYVVEVKSRQDSDDFVSALGRGTLAVANVRLDRSKAVSAVLTGAARQLTAGRVSEGDFLFVFYVLDGFSPHMQAEQLRATLWGTVRLIDIDDPSFSTPCFYFARSVFADHPEIDGVFVLLPSAGSGGLYPNRFSPRRIEHSFLGQQLARAKAVFTPEEASAQGGGLLADHGASDKRTRLLSVQRSSGRRRLSPMLSAGHQSAVRTSGQWVTTRISPRSKEVR